MSQRYCPRQVPRFDPPPHPVEMGKQPIAGDFRHDSQIRRDEMSFANCPDRFGKRLSPKSRPHTGYQSGSLCRDQRHSGQNGRTPRHSRKRLKCFANAFPELRPPPKKARPRRLDRASSRSDEEPRFRFRKGIRGITRHSKRLPTLPCRCFRTCQPAPPC